VGSMWRHAAAAIGIQRARSRRHCSDWPPGKDTQAPVMSCSCGVWPAASDPDSGRPGPLPGSPASLSDKAGRMSAPLYIRCTPLQGCKDKDSHSLTLLLQQASS
jgi:hypothetical protein